MNCRFCHNPVTQSVIDLGNSPVANDYIPLAQSSTKEPFYPLHAFVCTQCWLVQLKDFHTREDIFTDQYAYFSSYSSSWLQHAKTYAAMAIKRFGMTKNQKVVELASNDGYLLQYFRNAGIPVLGIEPTKNTAQVAIDKGIPTITEFFGAKTATSLVKVGHCADLLVANNVLAHVPDINDFVEGMKIILKSSGVATIEFPHLLNMIQFTQFDTIYHEHFSYFSLFTVQKIFAAHGLVIFDVEELPTHGGSLRIFVRHTSNAIYKTTDRVKTLINKELSFGLSSPDVYKLFSKKTETIKTRLVTLLRSFKKNGKRIAAYGAPAKGNTLLNYCGIGTDVIDFTVDKSPYKQNHLLPGSRIPVFAPDKIREMKPDYVLILPWNLKDEIIRDLTYIKEWGASCILPIPEPEIILL